MLQDNPVYTLSLESASSIPGWEDVYVMCNPDFFFFLLMIHVWSAFSSWNFTVDGFGVDDRDSFTFGVGHEVLEGVFDYAWWIRCDRWRF